MLRILRDTLKKVLKGYLLNFQSNIKYRFDAAYTEKGKIASDYGAPDSVIKYIENIDNENMRNKIKLDNYEKTKLTDILKIISIK